jgi:hypothetical protein
MKDRAVKKEKYLSTKTHTQAVKRIYLSTSFTWSVEIWKMPGKNKKSFANLFTSSKKVKKFKK